MQTIVDSSPPTNQDSHQAPSDIPTYTKTPIKEYFLVFVIYFGLILLFRLLSRDFSLFLRWHQLFFVIGGFVGMLIGLMDKIVYAYVTKPEDEFSVRVRGMIKHRQILGAIFALLDDQNEDRHLATTNVLFLGVWVLLGLFVVTSSLNGFARGLIMGIGLLLSYDLVIDLRRPHYLMKRLFWPINRQIEESETKILVYFFLGAFVFLSFLVI